METKHKRKEEYVSPTISSLHIELECGIANSSAGNVSTGGSGNSPSINGETNEKIEQEWTF